MCYPRWLARDWAFELKWWASNVDGDGFCYQISSKILFIRYRWSISQRVYSNHICIFQLVPFFNFLTRYFTIQQRHRDCKFQRIHMPTNSVASFPIFMEPMAIYVCEKFYLKLACPIPSRFVRRRSNVKMWRLWLGHCWADGHSDRLFLV